MELNITVKNSTHLLVTVVTTFASILSYPGDLPLVRCFISSWTSFTVKGYSGKSIWHDDSKKASIFSLSVWELN